MTDTHLEIVSHNVLWYKHSFRMGCATIIRLEYLGHVQKLKQVTFIYRQNLLAKHNNAKDIYISGNKHVYMITFIYNCAVQNCQQ